MYVCMYDVCMMYAYMHAWGSAARPPLPPTPWYRPPLPRCGSLWCGFPRAPLPGGCGRLPPLPWLLLVGIRLLRVWTFGCDTVPLNSDLP